MFARINKKYLKSGAFSELDEHENIEIKKNSGILSFIINNSIVVPIINIIDNRENSYVDYYIDVKNLNVGDFNIFQEFFDLHEEQTINNLNNASIVKMTSF